jgi:DNA-binding phage protein
MRRVTKEDMVDVLRAYLRRRVDECGGMREFARKTGVPHPQVSTAFSRDTGVSWGMLTKISETIGPRMSDLLADLARDAAQYEITARVRVGRKVAGGVQVATERARAVVDPDLVRQLNGESSNSTDAADAEPAADAERRSRRSEPPAGPSRPSRRNK